MIISALVPMIGLLIVLASAPRTTFTRARDRVLLGVFVFLCALTTKNPFITWCLIGAIAAFLRGASRFFHLRDEKALSEALPHFLDRVILSLKAGRPLKIALRESARELSPPARKKWAEISDRLEFSGSDDDLSRSDRELLRGFRDAGGGKITERLEAWRSSVRLREEFRRKSGQVTLQIRAQAALASLLFAPAFVWNVFGTDHPSVQRCVIAAVLFAAAQIWIHFGFGRWAWTV